ncbi:MAG TPA: thioredoxin, partial [Chitinophaga sp.]
MIRHLMALSLCLLTFGFTASAQETSSGQPAYKQYPVIPAFPLTLVDGHKITKNDLKKNVQTLVFVFSVECDHCMHMTDEIEKNIGKFKNTQILMVT